MKSLTKILIILISISAWPRGAGSSGGSGGAYPPDYMAAWFAQPHKSISFCIVRSDDFGYDLETAKSDLIWAFSKWESYLNDLKNPFPRLWPVTTVKYVETCEASTDVTFYLGNPSPSIAELLKNDKNSMGYSNEINYDKTAAWGRGEVWMTKAKTFNFAGVMIPNYSEPDVFKSLALHEIGHIMGNTHLEGTIMTENLYAIMAYPDNTPLRTRIDHARDLLECRASKCVKNYVHDFKETDTGEALFLFTKFMGHQPKGKYSISLLNVGPMTYNYSDTAMHMVFTDENDSGEFYFDPSANYLPWTLGSLFKVSAFNNLWNETGVYGTSSKFLISKTGEKVFVNISYNNSEAWGQPRIVLTHNSGPGLFGQVLFYDAINER